MQVAVVSVNSLYILDLRTMKRAAVVETAHAMPARDVDYNPKRPHLLVTAGDDCRVRFWDDRSLKGPLMDLVRVPGLAGCGLPWRPRPSES